MPRSIRRHITLAPLLALCVALLGSCAVGHAVGYERGSQDATAALTPIHAAQVATLEADVASLTAEVDALLVERRAVEEDFTALMATFMEWSE